jgi:bifunctional non-homologous end joining protein LigD
LPAKTEIEVDGRRLRLSNLDKVMYPATGFTKGHVIDYYVRVAPALLPHLRRRPLTLKRYPNGVEQSHFYEKRCPSHAPSWVKKARMIDIDFCRCDDVPTLVWLANLADLELHPSLSRAGAPKRPTTLAFDLDPGAPAGLRECCEVALRLRETFAELGLECFPKTSGSKGMQVYVPLNSKVGYKETKPFARAIAQLLEKRDKKLVTSVMAKAKRRGKVFIDWSQNDEHKTTVSVYSLRARERPTVSTPLDWDEVEARDPDKLVFEASELLERIEERGDLFEPVERLEQKLPRL